MASTSTAAGGASSLEHRRVTRLEGHSQSLLCCISPPTSPHLVATSGEDGKVCIFDLRSAARPQKYEISKEAVASLCCHPENENHIFAAAGKSIYLMDIRLGPDGKELCLFQFNSDEINQIAINQSGTFIAAADDSGEAKVIDLRGRKVFKTLRGGHSNICSSVQFHPRRSWEVFTGGLDCKILLWDFSRGKLIKTIDLSIDPGNHSLDLCGICNPPFVHALAVSEREFLSGAGKVLAVARGDGVVEVYTVASDRSKSSLNKCSSRSITNPHGKQKQGYSDFDALDCNVGHDALGRICRLGSENGGHTTAVSYATYSRFGQCGNFLISGGNDGNMKLWDCSNWSSNSPMQQQGWNPLRLNILHREKINWISTIASSSENLLVADTSTYLSIYSIL